MSSTADNNQSQAAATEGGLPESPNLIYALYALLAVGIGIAIYLVSIKLKLDTGLISQSSCNFGGTFNCDKVAVSDQAKMFDLPLALFAIPTYGVMAYLTWLGQKASGSKDADVRAQGALALCAVAAIGSITVVHAMYLAYVSTVKIGAYCLFCMGLYAVNIGSTALAVVAGPKTIGVAFQKSLEALTAAKPPVPMALVVVVLLGGISWIGYDTTKANWDAEALACIKKGEPANCMRKVDPVAVGADPAADPSAGAAAGGAAAGGAAAGGAVAGGQTPPPRPTSVPSPPPTGDCFKAKTLDLGAAKVSGKKTEDGYSEYLTPLDDECEFYLGPKDAKVTVVKYADFQCGYCRYLALTMDPVHKTYKDKSVRFVMKNFPMNVKCNPRMAGYDKHPFACEASFAGRCAGLQGKFWEFHDHLYANQDSINVENIKKWAADFKLDMARFEHCINAPETRAAINQEIQIAFRAGIYGTPRTYINGRLVTGSASKSILEYHIDLALKEAEGGPVGGEQKMAAKTDGTTMIQVNGANAPFWIDAYENGITKSGKAIQVPGQVPARINWYDAKSACEKAGKRLCTEAEWVTACAGKPAVDDNNNGMFGDDTVEGNMYPYGAFYKVGVCHDQGDKYQGKAVATGSKEECRTPSGIFDLAGNIGEWVSSDKEKITLMGGHASSTERAACNDRAYSPGAGRRNQTTGFRCCADANVRSAKANPAQLEPVIETYKFKPAPAFEAETTDGKKITERSFKGKATLINFFASWCGPCKKEMPYLVKHHKEFGPKGLQIIGVGVDTDAQASIDFAKEYNVTYPFITDPESVIMGRFMVYSMPSTFLIDKNGVVQFQSTGFKPEEDAQRLEDAIKRLL